MSPQPLRFEITIHRKTKQEFPPGLVTVPPFAGGDGVHRIIVFDADLVASMAMQLVERALVGALRDLLLRKQVIVGEKKPAVVVPPIDGVPPMPTAVEIARGAPRPHLLRKER